MIYSFRMNLAHAREMDTPTFAEYQNYRAVIKEKEDQI